MYLISAYFDSTTTKQLKRIIDTLAVQTGNDYMTENEVPPHLTISSFETRNPKNLKEAFFKLENEAAVPVRIISAGVFLPYVMYVAPVLNIELQHLSQRIYDVFSEREDVTINKCYRPYSWFPHITLGKKLDEQQMRTAFEVVQRHFAPLKGEIVRLGMAKTNPHMDLCEIQLQAYET